MSGNMTRIKNNQITVQTIDYTRLVPGTLVGTNFNANLTLNSNVTIIGNLAVSGNTSSINSVNTYVQDPLVVFNSGYTGSISGYDIGFLVNRNYSSLGPYGAVNTAWVWVENDQAFEAIATSTSGNALTSLTSSGFANAKMGNTTVTSLTSTGAISGPSFSTPSLVVTSGSFTTLQATNFSTGNAVISGGYITGLANLQTTNLTSTTSVATNLSSGNVLITGGNANGLTTLQATTAQATNLSTGNALITGGNANGLTTLQATTAQVTNFSSGNVLITGGVGSFTTAQATNFSTANALINTAGVTTLVATNLSSGNAVISGGYITGLANLQATNISGTSGVVTNFSSGNVVATLLSATTAQATNFSTANAQIASESVTTGVTTNFSTANARISGGYITGLANLQATNISGTTAVVTNFSTANAQIASESVTTGVTTNFSSGNVVLTGGYADNVAIGANTAATGAFTTVSASGVVTITNTNNTTGTSTGALIVSGGVGITKDLWVGGNVYAGNILGTTQSILTVEEPLLYLTGNLGAGYTYDIGFYSHFIGGPANKYAHTGLVRNYIDNDWYLFSNVGEPSGNVVNLADSNLIYDTLKLGGLFVQNTTPSTSTTTGALQVAGGVGIQGNLYVGGGSTFIGNASVGNISISGNITGTQTLVSVGSGIFYGNTGGAGALYAGISSGFAALTDTTIQSSGNLNSFVQINNQNINSGSNASTDFVATADNGTQNDTYIDMGINSSTYSVAGFGLSKANDGYLYVYGNTTTGGGNLLLATSTTNDIIFATNGQDTSNEIARFKNGVGLQIKSTTAATNTTSGALTVAGGAGIAGQLYAAGLNATTSGVTTEVATNFSSGNVLITGGNANGLTTLQATTAQATNFSSGNAVISGGSANGLTTLAATTGVVTNFSSGNVVAGTIKASGVSTLSGNVVAASGTGSSSTTTGALVVVGGAGISGNAYIGGTAIIGSALNYVPSNAPVQVGYNINNYSQFAIQNANSGNNASTDIAAVANNGSDLDTYIDMGIVSSTYSQAAYSLYKPNDGYLIVAGNTTTGGGNLILNTYQQNDIIFATGGTFANAEVARLHGNVSSSGYLNLAYTTNASPAANTGALRVQGGASFASNVYHGGATIMNGSKTAGYDTIIKGKNDDTLIWARPNATYDTVIIGNSATASSVVNGAKLVINTTDTIMLPVGTNAQRPGSAGFTDVAGMLRYSSTANAIEWFNGTSWASASTQFTVIVSNQFNGDSVTTGFTLTQAATTAGVIVSINGVVQIPTTAYSVSGTTLTFTEAPATGDVIDVRILTTTSTVTSLSSATGKAQVLVDDSTGITFESGNGALPIFNMPIGGGLVSLDANVSIASANSPTTIDSFSTSTYRSAKYIIQVTNGTNFQTQEALVVHNGTTPTIVTYGVVQTNGNLGVVGASISGGTVSVQFTAANATNTVRISREYLQL